MTATLDDVAKKIKQEPTVEEPAAREMVRRAREQGPSLTGSAYGQQSNSYVFTIGIGGSQQMGSVMKTYCWVAGTVQGVKDTNAKSFVGHGQHFGAHGPLELTDFGVERQVAPDDTVTPG